MKMLIGTAVGLLLAAAIVLTWSFAAAVPSPMSSEDGKATFMKAGCNTCHAVSAAGIEAKMKAGPMKGTDLTDVGSRHTAEWIAQYVRKEETLNGKSHAKAFKGTDEELQTLLDWLLEQNSK